MGETNVGETGPSPDAGRDAEKIEAIATALVEVFGDKAPAIVKRQGDAASEPVRRSWIAISMCVNRILAERQD